MHRCSFMFRNTDMTSEEIAELQAARQEQPAVLTTAEQAEKITEEVMK